MLSFPPPDEALLSHHPPRCLDCGYILDHLTAPRCPECGRPFDPADQRTYTRRPDFVFWKYWLPGFLLALGSGAAIGCVFLAMDSIGWGLSLGVPLMVGALLGYGVRARLWVRVLMALAGILTVVAAALVQHVAGMFCGIIIAGLFLVPTWLGLCAGMVLRNALKGGGFSQKWYLPIIALLLLPGLLHVAERAAGLAHPAEAVATAVELPVPVERAWRARLFESAGAPERGALMRAGLPRPVALAGQRAQVGGAKAATFTKGHLEVRVTRRDENRLLAFEFTGQSHLEGRAVRLLESEFRFEPLSASRTRATLATRYEPLMSPRWYWRPLERLSGHTMHRYLLAELEQAARADSTARQAIAEAQ